MMLCDIVIITTAFFLPDGDVDKLLYGYCTLIIVNLMLDYVVDRGRQSVQFLIFSRQYDAIAAAISATHRGVTVLDGQGWYTKEERKVLVVLAKNAKAQISSASYKASTLTPLFRSRRLSVCLARASTA